MEKHSNQINIPWRNKENGSWLKLTNGFRYFIMKNTQDCRHYQCQSSFKNGLIFTYCCLSLNPGPVRNPCGICRRPVAKNHLAVQCEACYFWHHIKCENISPTEYSVLCGDDKAWICKNCLNFHFSDSFLEGFGLIIYVPSTIFQLYRDGSSWVEPVLS